MSFLTKVITDTSPDFGDNPQIVTENGQPSSVNVENLVPNTGYWTKAEIWQNGVLNDTSEVEDFQTLPAGTITLTHQSSVRSGSNYIVTYTYTSTYALSSSVLTCGVSISSQGVIAGNTITFTVSGLVPGDAYMSQITTIDMYGESAQTSITLIMPVVNEVSITGTTTTSSTVVCELDYTIDGGFTQGWVDYWDENADPSTDQPQGHATFTDGADTCTITGLTDGTTYQLRATIYYGGYVNYVVSSVVTATTNIDYTTKYFTITNKEGGASVYLYDSNANTDVSVSTDNGVTWTTYTGSASGNGRELARLSQTGDNVLLKHTGSLGNRRINVICNSQNAKVELSGNAASLCFGDSFTGVGKTVPQGGYQNLFGGALTTGTVYAEHMTFASYTIVSDMGMEGVFSGCTSLATAPDISSIRTVNRRGMTGMFSGCTSLTTPPSLRNIRSVGEQGMAGMFNGCASITSQPNTSSIQTVGDYGMNSMFKNCRSLTTMPNLRNITSLGAAGMAEMFSGCGSLTTVRDLSGITSVGSTTMYMMFSNCTSLTAPPALSSVTTVAANGMNGMFWNCTSLRTGPDLTKITSVDNTGMERMFYNCSNLVEAYAPKITWDTDKTKNWLENVAAEGKIYCWNQSIMNSIPNNSISGCPSGWTKEIKS